ncbi:MAG: invasion associated locus B family protein [Roseicyclus sp.]
MAMSIHVLRSVVAAAAAAAVSMTAAPLALAQSATAERTPGEAYVAEVFTDWELRCVNPAEEGQPEQCEMFQIMLDEQDNPVAVFRVSVPLALSEGQVAAAVIVTPLETLLAPGIRIRIDESEPVGVPFTLCDTGGCLARIPLDQDSIDMFQAGGDAFLEIFALVRSELGEVGGVPIPLTASLRGFTAAYEALQERHADFAAFVEAEMQSRDEAGNGEASE